METRAVLRGVRLSADKGRLVADLIRGKKVEQALNILAFTPKKAAVIVKKVLESAVANAEHNDSADIDELRVTSIYIEQGTKQARQKHERGGILWLIYSASALIFLFLLGRKYRLPNEYKI